MQYSPTIAPETLLAEHREFEARHAAALHAAWRPHANDRRADRPLRLGFVSPDFACHPVGMLLVRVLEQLSRDRATLVCYHDREGDDAWTARFRAAATTWHVVRGWTDATLAQQIRDDAIDVLFDLAGHTEGNRLLVFARKPAPIQISWAGYQGTTGLTAMDYLLTDRTAVPVKYESCYVERILRMPDGYACFDPPPDAPPVAPLPAAGGAPFTYASFNNPAKILRPVVEAWAEILRQVPGARLVLKYRGLDDLQVQARYYGWFAAQGIPAERIFLRGSLPWADRLKAYDEVDLCLDPFPYSGSMTTCEALWMGVPVLTWPATLFAGRQTQGHLNCLGLDEFVADSRSDYVRRAVAAAGDLPRLARLRGELRPRMAASPLCDAPRFAENLMRLLRQAWREWVARSDAPPT